MHKVQDRDPNSTVNPDQQIVLDGLLPNPYRRRRFYRYPGSLTTPPCTEGITWLVMADSNSIGLEQVHTGHNTDVLDLFAVDMFLGIQNSLSAPCQQWRLVRNA